MDKFAEYLQQHRQDLQLSRVDPEIWSGIERALAPRRKRVRRNRLLRVAAVGLLLLGVASFFLLRTPSRVVFAPEQLIAYGFTDGQPPVATIDQKIRLVGSLSVPAQRATDFQLLLEQVRQLDRLYANELAALTRGNSGTAQQRRVLNYYRKKADLLDDLLAQIKKTIEYADDFDTTGPRTVLEL